MKISQKRRQFQLYRIVILLILFISIFSLSYIHFRDYHSKKTLQEIIDQNDNIKIEEDESNRIIKNLLLEKLDNPVSPKDFVELRKREELHTSLWNKLIGKINNYLDDNEVINYKKYLIEKTSFIFQSDQSDLSLDQKILAFLHKSLYSWVYGYRYNSLSQLLESSNGRGIVICTGDVHFQYARSAIDIIRNVHNSTLPIEVFYNGFEDLSIKNQQKFHDLPNVYLSDIGTYFNNYIVNIYGWAIKPFAILASRFDEVILMDADVLFMNNPEELFNDQGYIETGTLFFKDRTIAPGPHAGSEWLHSWMKDPLPETKKLRFYNKESKHEMESGTVVINKTKTLLGLLNACKLNEDDIRKIVYKYVYGDKETFWMGFDMARQHYYFDPEPCGFYGDLCKAKNDDNDYICGHIAHTQNGKLIFWNGHIIKDKKNKEERNILVNFNAYAIGYDDVKWDFSYRCLKMDNATSPILLNEKEKSIMNKIFERENEYHFVIPKK